MWYSPHDGNITASLGILRRGKTAVKSVLSFTVWFICVSTWFIYPGPRSIISYFWSHEQLLSAGGLSYAVLKYKCTQTSLSFWTCRHQSEIFVWHEVFYIKKIRTHCETVTRWLAPFREIKKSLTQTKWQLPGIVTSWRHPETSSEHRIKYRPLIGQWSVS